MPTEEPSTHTDPAAAPGPVRDAYRGLVHIAADLDESTEAKIADAYRKLSRTKRYAQLADAAADFVYDRGRVIEHADGTDFDYVAGVDGDDAALAQLRGIGEGYALDVALFILARDGMTDDEWADATSGWSRWVPLPALRASTDTTLDLPAPVDRRSAPGRRPTPGHVQRVRPAPAPGKIPIPQQRQTMAEVEASLIRATRRARRRRLNVWSFLLWASVAPALGISGVMAGQGNGPGAALAALVTISLAVLAGMMHYKGSKA